MLPRGVRVANVGVGLFSEHGNRGNKPPFPSSAGAAESAESLSYCCRRDSSWDAAQRDGFRAREECIFVHVFIT